MMRIFGATRTISDMYLTVTNAACMDTFSTMSWDDLKAVPPTKLEENFFTCTQYWYDAMFDSLGIASVRTGYVAAR